MLYKKNKKARNEFHTVEAFINGRHDENITANSLNMIHLEKNQFIRITSIVLSFVHSKLDYS